MQIFKNKIFSSFIFPVYLISFSVSAQMHDMQTHAMSPKDCSEMLAWDFETASCQPLAMPGMPSSMWMIHGNTFAVQSFMESPRGRNQFSVPNMIMGDIGTSVGKKNYVNLDLMMTFEKWTFSDRGYPEFLQIGETDKDDLPYVDAQHPHSSPVMGLTLSDTLSLGNKDHIKFYFSPRGQPTEGPVAFMHRQTGMVNPDAPLGHHIGQDVSHISSTVLGTSFHLGKFTLEASVFNGTEPEPTKVDLPIDKLNSHAERLIYEFTDDLYAMASASYVKDPESHDLSLKRIYRYSSSIYYQKKFESGLMFHNTFIFGLVNFYDHYSKLRSFGNEFLLHSMDLPHNFWGRIELLERGASQLRIEATNNPKWVEAFTMGYTYDICKFDNGKIGIGGSITKSIIPSVFENAYGTDPLSGKIFIQLSGMKMGPL
ncbi:MAG: hypothetical protein H7177_16150 [Rhizobacter sp.]|nr:hypothetical protein [Bacteriovorax sp.]